MTDKINRMVSKRPMRAKSSLTPKQIEESIEKLEKLIAREQAIVNAKESDPSFLIVLRDSNRRLQEIAMKAMSIPADDSLAHASAVGQFNERLLLTNEIANSKTRVMKQEGLLKNALKRLGELRIKKTKD